MIQGKHGLILIDNTATVAYLNYQSSVCSSHVHNSPAILWSQQRLKSQQANHIPGNLKHYFMTGYTM